MDVRLLGPIEVRLEDGPIELGPRKQRAVLAMLALEPGRTVVGGPPRGGLWGDEPPPSAAKMVQLYVSHLRRAARRQRRADRDPRARLRAAAGRRRGRRACWPSGCSTSAGRATRSRCGAASRWPTWPRSRSRPREIRRLEELRLRAAEMAIDADLAAGRHARGDRRAGRAGRRAPAARAPARASACSRSTAAAASRRRSRPTATRAPALVEEIGVEPGAELRRLQDAILAQDPALDLPAAADAEPATEPRPPPPRRSGALLVGAAALLLAGVTAFGRHPRPRARRARRASTRTPSG